jgi:hypothetical protein
MTIDFEKAYDLVRGEVFYNTLIGFEVPMKLVRLIKICLNETYNKVHIGKYLSYNFPIQNDLRQGEHLSQLLFNFSLVYAMRKVQENHVVLELNGTHQLLVYADDLNLLGDNIDTAKKNRESLIGANKEVGLEANTEKTKYMFLSHYKNARKHHDIQIANRFLKNVAQFKYLGTKVTNQDFIQKEIKARMNSGNACYHSVQNLLLSHLLCKNIKTRIYKTIILPVVLYGYENCSLTLRE